jgi:predicted nucleic acid-binding protein
VGRAGDEAGRELIAFLDTNVAVRHLTGSPPEQAARATRFLAGSRGLLLTDVAAAECVYVLESVYGRDRRSVAEAVRSLIGLPAVQVLDVPLLIRALALYEHLRVHFANAYIAAAAEISGVGAVASFDRGLDRVDTIRRVEP